MRTNQHDPGLASSLAWRTGGATRACSGSCGRFSFIYSPSASRGHAVERALHLLFNALNGPAADATLAGNPQDAFADAQFRLDALFEGGIDPRSAEPLALRYGALKASMNTLPDHAALKLGLLPCTMYFDTVD
jgi:hypothetical protein